METLNISILSMLLVYGLLAVPFAFIFLLRLGNASAVGIAVLRMTAQLVVMGFYLDFMFRLQNGWVNFGWVLLMIAIANFTLNKNAGLKTRHFFAVNFAGMVIGSFFVLAVFVFAALRPTPFYDARYLIPISGMVVGNCMRANVISLERFYSSIRKNEKEYLTYLLMGATLHEAASPYLREAIKPALAPTVATMATLGIVSLPGMMTGQILGGSSPMIAIKYQIAVMIAIFTGIIISCVINIMLSMRIAFNDYQVLRRDLFRGR